MRATHHPPNPTTDRIAAMDASARKHLATRIHYALLRYLGTGIDADRMLADAGYAREVLFVCEGSRDEVLQGLGREFVASGAPAARPRAPVSLPRSPAARPVAAAGRAPGPAAVVAAPQDARWAQDTSGFGFLTPSDFQDERIDPVAPQKRFPLPRWLRRDGRRA